MRQLGQYTLSQRIGSGGMAEVWLAQRPTMGHHHKTVAVKLLASNYADKPEYRALFLEEARLSMLLNNSAIVHVFDAGEVQGECYLAMEWINGVNLSELQTQMWEMGERLPLHVGVYIIAEVLRALDFAHNLHADGASTVVHRDVSPQNVMLSRAGEVKLMDFGVARFSTEETSGVHVKGKLRYMPPEQLRGQSRDPTVDLFPVGAMLHEMIDGRRFRDTTDEGRLIGMIFSGEIPPLSVAPASIPPQIEALRQALLAHEASMRVPSARDALRMLAAWPHHRNAAMDLAALVQRQQDWNRARHEATAITPPPAPNHNDTSASRRTTGPGPNPSTGSSLRMNDTSRGSGRRSRVVPRRRQLAAVLVAGMGVLFGGLGIGVAIQQSLAAESKVVGADMGFALPRFWVHDLVEFGRSRLPKPVAPTPEPSDEIVLLPPDPPPSDPEPAPDLEPEVGSESEMAPELEPEAGVTVTHKLPPPKPPPPVQVKFVDKTGKVCMIRVNRKIHTLQPFAKIDIPATSQSVQIRRPTEKNWKPGKAKIKLTPNHTYKVVVDCDAGTATVQTES
ncbi:serine/threonine protein kinase [Nannocystaceae bacterium ST9]